MLQDKLNHAARKATRTRLTAVLVICGVAVTVGIGIFSINGSPDLANLEPRLTAPAAPAAVTETPRQLTEQPVAANAADPVLTPPAPIRAQLNASEVVPATQAPRVPENTQDREAFKEVLRKLEGGPEPVINSDPYKAWRPETQRDIAFLKQQGINFFSATDYGQARSHMQKALVMAETEARAFEAAFQTALGAARAAKLVDDYGTASASISEALALAPEAQEALDLKPLIDAMPDVLALLKSAGQAARENNLQAEYRDLKKASSLDPSRKDISARADKLAGAITEARFSKYVTAGLANVERRQLKQAQAQWGSARKLFPKREETQILGDKVAALKNDLQTERHIADAKTAAAVDDWQQSLALYRKAQSIQPNNQIAIVGAQLAQSITQLAQKIDQNLRNENRLASKNVASTARRLLKTAAALNRNSPSLDRQAQILAAKLDAYGVDVAVVVTSDEKTKVSVRGVGQVGIVAQKTIKLKPGSYTFEGKRDGFKSKLVRVNIPPGSNSFQVTVVSDERI